MPDIPPLSHLQYERAEAASVSPLASESTAVAEHEGRAASRVPSLWGYPATYILLAINVVVFALMLYASADLVRQHGIAGFFTGELDADVILRFGASHSAVAQSGEWWRLLTASFVHVTFLHLALNMWCLWNLGLFGEPLLGKPGLIAVYLLTGTAGMMLSLAWSVFAREPGIVAGASGAVFGLAGILIVLLSNRRLSLPWEELRSLRRSVIWFAVLNLAIGILPQLLPGLPGVLLGPMHLSPDSLPRIDNRAHLGGFIAGLALGVPLFPRMTSGKSSYRARQALVFSGAALLLCLLAYGLAAFAA